MRSCLPSVRLTGLLEKQQDEPAKNASATIDMENNSRLLVLDRRRALWQGVCGIASMGVMYLVSELLLWGLSRVLAPARQEFFSSVIGMLLVFVLMLLSCAVVPSLDGVYERHIRSKVDFINRHMGAAFAIPMVMLGRGHAMDTRTIGLVVGVFVATSLVAWTTVYMLAKFTHLVITRLFDLLPGSVNVIPGQYGVEMAARSQITSDEAGNSDSSGTLDTAALRQPVIWTWLCQFWPLVASLLAMVTVGLPLAAAVGEPRILDGSALWLAWIASVTLQRVMKQKVKSYAKPPKVLPVLTTLANPVLLTILIMTAYARAKACATSTSIADVLDRLSSGTQLYKIWTDGVQQGPAAQGQWFGAGDAALSMLGCGFVVWGFKLYECRRQLFSASGLVTVLVSVAAAAGNVFLGTHAGFLMGLQRPEALAFAARMTTLALAIPAMRNVAGNTSLTVALMITNGILGQLAYPASLTGLGARTNRMKPSPSTDSCDSTATTATATTNATSPRCEYEHVDSADTVAAGITIGINGAAMGVAWLYENKSRSAPYAALAMTTYGVVTVVLIAVHPFKDALLGLV